MPRPTEALTGRYVVPALEASEAAELARCLDGGEPTVFVDGTSLRLGADAAAAVTELLRRLGAGESVELATAQTWLNTSQAARAAGISQTYLRNLTDAGEIPVTYRGTHRRFRPSDIAAWAEARSAREQGGAS